MTRSAIQRWVAITACLLVLTVAGGCPGMQQVPVEGEWPIQKNLELWTIYVTSYTEQGQDVPGFDPAWDQADAGRQGQGRRQSAEQVVRILRRDHNLPAYWQHDAGPEGNASAVFVGGWESHRDPKAAETIRRLREIVRGLPQVQPRRLGLILVPNPIAGDLAEERPDVVPAEAFPQEINDRPYSLLHDCPGQYTLVLKVFRGRSVIVGPETPDDLLEQTEIPSGLETVEKQANAVTDALREQGLPAYVLHRWRSSLVCIGSYDDWKGPEILVDSRRYTGLTVRVNMPGAGPEGEPVPTELRFDQPLPMIVPKYTQ